MGLQTIGKGQLPLASDVNQLVLLAQGKTDVGGITLPAPVAASTTAPSTTLSAGSLSGSYQWGFYWITGTVNDSGTVSVTGRTTPSTYSAAQTLSSQQASVSISSQTIPTTVIGWGVVRNKAGGSTWYEVPGSEQFGNNDGTNIPQTYLDNTPDTNLTATAPSTNTTGTPLTAPYLSASGLTGATGLSRYVGGTVSGAPSTGTFRVGDFVVDQSGVIWVCISSGSPGTWKSNVLKASGQWIPTSGVLNVAKYATVNVGTVPTGATIAFFDDDSQSGTGSGYVVTSSNYNFGIVGDGTSGAMIPWHNNVGQANLTTLYDGAYMATGVFQISGGYLQFQVYTTTANTTKTSNVSWAVT